MAYAACVLSRPLYNALKPLFVSGTGKLCRGFSTLHHFSNMRPLTSSCLSKASPPTVVLALALARRSFSSKEEPIASPADLQFESPLKIVEYPDPLLREANKRINTFDDNLKKLVDEMFDIMYKTDGIGLSAPQVGLNIQLMVFNPAGERGVGEELVLINPRVYKYSKKIVPFNEGCLSFPGIYADVERPAAIKVDAQDITGAKFSISLKGLPARIFQHEFDHLQVPLLRDGITLQDVDYLWHTF
ncbi:Peptide deformylase 1B [Nymphaea thermarum]|nr:Peptide deformylase 1B [Nymphaea thermarum]